MTIDLSSIVSVEEYKARAGRLNSDTVDDDVITDLGTAVTRVLERRLRIAPGMLVPQTGLTFTFSAHGGAVLRLRDDMGRQLFLRSITPDSLKIDTDLDGAFDDYLLDTADAWVELRPVNAAQFGEPYTAVALRSISGATITNFPSAESCVQIVGDWGYASTPGTLRERAYGIMRELLDAERAGGSQVSQYDVEEAINRVPNARALLAVLEREYSRKIPVVA